MCTVLGNFVMGVFPTREKAVQVIRQLELAGFSDSDVSIITCQDERSDDGLSAVSPLASEKRESIVKSTWTGVLLGVTAGSLGMVALATISLAGFDPVKHREMLSMLMSGAVAGALAGGVVGNLIGLSLSERQGRDIEYAILAGWNAVKVCTETRQAEAAAIIDGNDARQSEFLSEDESQRVAINELAVGAGP